MAWNVYWYDDEWEKIMEAPADAMGPSMHAKKWLYDKLKQRGNTVHKLAVRENIPEALIEIPVEKVAWVFDFVMLQSDHFDEGQLRDSLRIVRDARPHAFIAVLTRLPVSQNWPDDVAAIHVFALRDHPEDAVCGLDDALRAQGC